MPELDIEAVVDKLMIFLLEDMEMHGATINISYFNLGPDKEDSKAFIALYPELEPQLIPALNVCISRGLLKHRTLGNEYDSLAMTREGHARALSVKLAKPRQPDQPGIVINNLHANAPVQVGHGNTMTIEAFHAAAAARIDAADATETEKVEAKGLLAKVLEHPLLCAVVGGLVGALVPTPSGKR